jgi:hypothetical protein
VSAEGESHQQARSRPNARAWPNESTEALFLAIDEREGPSDVVKAFVELNRGNRPRTLKAIQGHLRILLAKRDPRAMSREDRVKRLVHQLAWLHDKGFWCDGLGRMRTDATRYGSQRKRRRARQPAPSPPVLRAERSETAGVQSAQLDVSLVKRVRYYVLGVDLGDLSKEQAFDKIAQLVGGLK